MTTIVGAADIMANPPRFSRGYAMGGKVHALTAFSKSPTTISVETVCGRSGAAAGLWEPEAWPKMHETFTCSRCVNKLRKETS